jgi:hypothetical protein
MANGKARRRSGTRAKVAVPARSRTVIPVERNTELQEVLPDMFLRLFDALLEAGVPKAQIIEAAARAAVDRDSIRRVNYRALTDLGTAVIGRWHSDPAYMRNGLPAPLPREGNVPSVATLVASSVPATMRDDVIRLLEGSPSIRVKFGGTQWECGDKVLRLRGPAAAVRVADVVEIAVRTLLTNVGALRGAVAPLDIQCDAELPDAAVPVFMEKASAHMRLSIDDMHRLLEAAEVKSKSKRTGSSRVGLMVLGFVTPTRNSKKL